MAALPVDVKNNDTNEHKREPYPYEVEQDEEKSHPLNQHADIATKLQLIRSLHLECVHYEALDEIHKLEEYIKQKYDTKLLHSLHLHPRIQSIHTEIAAADNMLRLMTSSEDDWKLVKNDGQWTTEFKQETNTAYHSFRLKGIGKVQMINVLAIFYEMDLIQNWMPLCKETYQIQQLSLYCKCGYVRVGAFWPFQDREVVLFGYGVDDLKRNNKLLICFDSNVEPHRDILQKFGIKLPEKVNNRVRIDIKIGGILLEKVENDLNATKISLLWNVDPGVAVPASLLNWMVGQFAGKLLGSIVNSANSIVNDEKYQERFVRNEEFYGSVTKKLQAMR
mmetsp:Transcript_11028/g.17720  ORF Transcript_11028/g.17720 Transcript_11028/m.17720 type:complete len:335 (+) Transcript_11028:26-1030(+)